MTARRSADTRKLYELAEPQAGYFTTAQAHSVGFSRSLLTYFVKTGRFKRVAQGVYRLTQFPNSPFEDLFVAWLRIGHDAVISHESALAVYELSDALPTELHVIMPRTGSRCRAGIRLHKNQLHSDEITHRAGLPVTTVARTVADIAINGAPEELVRQAVTEALRRGLVTANELTTQAKRRNGRAAAIINTALAKGSQ